MLAVEICSERQRFPVVSCWHTCECNKAHIYSKLESVLSSGPNFSKRKKGQTQPQKTKKHNKRWKSPTFPAPRPSRSCSWIFFQERFIVRRTNLRSSLSRKKLFAPVGSKLWAGHQTLWLMGRLLQRRGLALIGTRGFKGTVSVAQGPEKVQGPPNLCFPRLQKKHNP